MHTTIPSFHGIDLETNDQFRQILNQAIIVDAHAFGYFRKDLIRTIGMERTKGFLFRYGWKMGVHDAKACKEKKSNHSLKELIEFGPVMHSLKGFVESKTIHLEIQNVTDASFTLIMESVWENSLEADEHINQIGISSGPVCFTLTGYASGYVTEICGQKIIFKESSCRGAGSKQCYAVGKNISQWGNEIEDELYYLDEIPIVKELEQTYEKVLQERNFLSIANDIHRKLLEEVIKGNSIQTIIQEANKLSGFPVIIHNVHGHPIASAGIDSLSKGLTPGVLFQYINNDTRTNKFIAPTLQPIQRQYDSLLMLTQPIYLHDKRMGYCSFVFKDPEKNTQELSKMILEKVTSVCSLSFLYEKTKLDSYEQMKSFFLQEIISGQFSSEDEIIAKAGLLHYDLTKPYYLCLIGYSYNPYDFHNEWTFCREVMSTITHYFSKQNKTFLMNQNDHHIQLFVTDYFLINADKYSFFKELIKFLHSRFPGSSFDLGVSDKKHSSLDAPNAYKEAKASIRMISSKKQIVYFESLGIVGTLINGNNEDDVRNMAKSLLGNLKIKGQKNIDLIRTLYSFLLNGGNLEKSAEELSLSISGLRYRVNKIEELLDKDIRSPIISSQLLMAIQGLILLGDITMKDPK